MKKIGFLLSGSLLAACSALATPEALKFPYVSTYYVKPIVTPDEEVGVGFYVTDYASSKARFFDDSHVFEAVLEYRPKGTKAWTRRVLRDLRSGDHAFALGRLAEGDWEMRVWAVDREGRESHRVLHDFRVRATKAPSAAETYVMTSADLAKYGIRNDGDLSTIVWEGMPDGEKTVRTKNAKRPGYTVRVPTKDGKPVFRSFKSAKIVFDDGYDAAAVEKESLANAEGLQRLLDEKASAGVRLFRLLPGTYRLSAKRAIVMPDDFTLDLNGATLKQNAFTGSHSTLVRFESARNACLRNGTLEGDYYEHDYKRSPNDSEWPMGFNFGGASEYCTVEKVKVVDITGYGGGNGISSDRRGSHAYACEYLGRFAPGGLDAKTGLVNTADTARVTTDFQPLAKVAATGRLQVSKYLGYQGMGARSWHMTVCWYDADRRFLSSETSWQYREMFVPEGAAYLRVSVEEGKPSAADACEFVMVRFRVPTNCTVKDCTFERCRCVGYAASALKNMLFEGNFFTASGECAAMCAFDAEDGWDQMQDCYFLRNTFRANPVNNSILTCCGHNFILEKNDCAIHFWDRTHSPCVRDNRILSASYNCAWLLRSGYGRFRDNRYEGRIELGHPEYDPCNDYWDFDVKSAPTKVMFFFDTEDFTCDESSDAIRETAKILTEEGVRGEYNVVGYLARELMRLKRRDVIDALKPHAIGTQTLGHSVHPTICEMTDMPDYKVAYANAYKAEREGVDLLKKAFSLDHIDYAVPPGNSWSYASLYAFADLGMTFYGGGGFADVGPRYSDAEGLVPPGLRHWGLWYCNLLQLPYSEIMSLEFLIPSGADWKMPDVDKALGVAARRDFVVFYMHPHMALKPQHWDAPNYLGHNRVEWGRWIQITNRPPEATAAFYRNFRAFVRRVKADPRFTVTDTLAEKAKLKPRVEITTKHVPAIRKALAKDFGAVSSPASWCLYDVFQAAAAFLRGEKSYRPAKAYGFLERPKGVTAATEVSAADLRAAAEKLPRTGFLPASVEVGGKAIGPRDFLVAALEVIEKNLKSVRLAPCDQLGSFAKCPSLEKVDIKGGWCIHSPDLNGKLLDERLKLQLWTLRME